MKTKKALDFRQQFGSILDDMGKGSEPVIIEKNSKPVAVLISYDLFRQRFIDFQNEKERQDLLSRFKHSLKTSEYSSTDIVRELRYGKI